MTMEPKLCSICSVFGVKMKAIVSCPTCNLQYCAACTPDHRETLLDRHTMEVIGESTAADRDSLAFSQEVRKSFHRQFSKGYQESTFSDEMLHLLGRMMRSSSSETKCEPKCAKKCESLQVFFVDEFRTASEDDVRPCYVTGCLPLENKQVLVIDKNNMKMKLFDSNFRITASVKTQQTTWGVTALTRNTIATCGCGSKVITWKILNNKIWKEKEVKVPGVAYGISNNTSFICTMNPGTNSLTLISRSTNAIIWQQEFPKAFEKPVSFGFDLHLDDTKAYVGCALGDRRILCINLISAKILWECPLPGNTCGITEVYDQLLVVDMTGRKVHAVSKEGVYQEQVVTLEYRENRPQYLGSSANGRTLFVSEYGGGTLSLFSPRIK